MSNKILFDSFDAPATTHWEMNEFANDKKVVDGKYILARVVGPMFSPGGDSLNGRHYTKRLWELAIQRNKDRLNNNMVLGTLGHDTEINDTTLGEGKISHKVVNMWIDEKTGAGMGEIHVMGTQAGQALNSLLRAQVPLQVSTRATGELSNRKSPSGLPIIDEESYSFQGIDFVSKGGIKGATPQLVETHEDNFHPNVHINPEDIHISSSTNSPIQEIKMSDKLLESLTAEKIQLKDSLTEALNANKTLISERDALRLEKNQRQDEVNRTVTSLEEARARVTTLESQVADLQNQAKSNEAFGNPKSLSEELAETKKIVENYSTEFGNVEELNRAFELANTMVEQYREFGSPNVLSSIMEEFSEFKELDLTAVEIEESLDLLEEYKKEASLEDLKTSLKLIEEYTPLGSPEQIERAFSTTDRAIAVIKSRQLKADAGEISKKYKLSTEKVEEMLNKLGKEGTVSFLEDFNKQNTIKDRYNVGSTKNTNSKIHESANSSDSDDDFRQPAKTTAEKMLERFTRVTEPSKNSFPKYE